MIQLLEPLNGSASGYVTWIRYGRVGENGQTSPTSKLPLAQAQRAFEKKFREKTGLPWENRLDPPRPGKYTFVERNYEESDDEDEDDDEDEKPKKSNKEEADEEAPSESKPAESTLPKSVQQLVALIFNAQHFQQAMASMSYDANKLPLGKLSKRTLNAGFQTLKDLAEVVNDPSSALRNHNMQFLHAAERLSNIYFTTIPHAFGRARPPIINTPALIKREVDLLEALTDMGIANEILKTAKSSEDDLHVHPLDRQFQGLNLDEMTPSKSIHIYIYLSSIAALFNLLLLSLVDRGTNEFQELENYLTGSHGANHRLHSKVWTIAILKIKPRDPIKTDRYNMYNICTNRPKKTRFNMSSESNVTGKRNASSSHPMPI